VYEVAARGHADLPLVQVCAPGAGAHGGVHVNVIEDDERVIAAQLQVRPLQQPSRCLADLASGASRAGERDDTNSRVLNERHPDIGTAREHREQALRQPGLLQNHGEKQAASDCGACVGLEHDRVAERERGCHRSHREHTGKVER
jgi:hypothetical protein